MKRYHTAFWFWLSLPNHCCIYSTTSFVLHPVNTASSCWCRYSCPHKSPDTDLDQVDKSLPPLICHTGSLPGAKGQMERDSSCITFSPLLEISLHVKYEAERAVCSLNPVRHVEQCSSAILWTNSATAPSDIMIH